MDALGGRRLALVAQSHRAQRHLCQQRHHGRAARRDDQGRSDGTRSDQSRAQAVYNEGGEKGHVELMMDNAGWKGCYVLCVVCVLGTSQMSC